MSGNARTLLGATAGLIGRAVLWAVITASVLLLALGFVLPRLAGAMPYTVLTGSMEPALPPGTMVIVRPTDGPIRTGAVITYQLRSGEPEVVTHRVVEQAVSTGDGERILRTQGDANPGPDPDWVREVQVRGVVWYAIPGIGWLTQWLTGQQRIVVVTLVAVGLFGYAAAMFVSAARDRRKAGQAPTDEVEVADEVESGPRSPDDLVGSGSGPRRAR